MGFRQKSLEKKSFDSFGDLFFPSARTFVTMRKPAVLFLMIVCVIVFSGQAYRFMVSTVTAISIKTATVLSEMVGKDMIRDENGNINVLLIGMGGKGWAGGTLADTIIAVSFNPVLNSATMVSIPRDLYIYEKNLYAGKINSVFAQQYSFHQGDLILAASGMAAKISDVLGIRIPYFGLIDFQGFEKLIDLVGGLEIDIPEQIFDTMYPGEVTYTTFRIDPGLQTLDGATALKYARSRHSTSDFDRSRRQQLIIQAFIDKMTSRGVLTNPGSIRALYNQVSSMVVTNVEYDEMVGLIKYLAAGKPKIHRFGLTMECNDMSWKTMKPGCLLYPGVRDDFGGMSVLLPRGSTAHNPNMFAYTKYFGYMVMDRQAFLNEGARLHVLNAIDPAVARRYRFRNGMASQMATKLIRYGFVVDEATNADNNREKTVLLIPAGSQTRYAETIKMLRLFVDFEVEELPHPLPSEIGTGNTANASALVSQEQEVLRLELGADFMAVFGSRSFDLYMREE
ncbi:MAG: LCP family protein [Candidatus Absconditabacterales bacterium]|nr:LCP family protein [Candidatus Absconditabacterales bacterium]